MDALPWLILAGVGVVLLFAPIPKRFRNRSHIPKRKKYPTSGALLGAINEIFQPSAANSAMVIEEQKVARKATPSPEDKPHNKKDPVE